MLRRINCYHGLCGKNGLSRKASLHDDIKLRAGAAIQVPALFQLYTLKESCLPLVAYIGKRKNHGCADRQFNKDRYRAVTAHGWIEKKECFLEDITSILLEGGQNQE